MITLNDLLNIINYEEVILIRSSDGRIVFDNHDTTLYELQNNDYYDMWLDDNYNREVIDITVVKRDLCLDETTLMITIE
ncbi:MAG: hypothetical protein MJZ37_08370 [Bacilli bacterium]|nr:hypothetical protein [Bacilli bacterium]